MSPVILFATAVVFAVTTRSVLTSTRPGDAALDAELPADRATDPAADTLAASISQTPGPADPTDWKLMTVTSLRDAERLLDWIEAHGFAERELVVLGNASFAVRWR